MKVLSFSSTFICCTLSVLLGATFVFAQSTTTATTSDQTATTTVATTTEMTTVATGTADTFGVKLPPLSDASRARVINLSANMSNRVDAAIARFEHILVRMESRTVKMEALGYDMSNTKEQQQQARAMLDSLTQSFSNIDSKIGAFINAENYYEVWSEIRTTFVEAKSQLTQVKQLLRTGIDDMKTAQQTGVQTEQNTDTQTATSSETNSATSAPVL